MAMAHPRPYAGDPGGGADGKKGVEVAGLVQGQVAIMWTLRSVYFCTLRICFPVYPS